MEKIRNGIYLVTVDQEEVTFADLNLDGDSTYKIWKEGGKWMIKETAGRYVTEENDGYRL